MPRHVFRVHVMLVLDLLWIWGHVFGSMLCSFWTCYGFEDTFWVHVMLVLDLLQTWGGTKHATWHVNVRLWVHNMVGYERNMYVPGYHETCLGIIIIRWKNDRAKRKRADWGKK
jgi:hypothetical protein